MRLSKIRHLVHTVVSSETLSHLRPWVRFSQLEQQSKPQDVARSIVSEFEQFREKQEPLMKYIIKKEEVSLVGMYLLRSYALHGISKRKLKALIDHLLECKSPLYRKELWNTFLSCLCESSDVVDADFLEELQEQMSFYNIEANANSFMYLIVLSLQSGLDPTPLYTSMVSKKITPSVSLIRSVLQNMSRCFPDNELIMEIATMYLSEEISDESIPFPLQKLTLWMLWIAKDASLSPILLPMFMQLLTKQIRNLPETEKKRLASSTESREDSTNESTKGTEEKTESPENQVICSFLKAPVIRQMEQHCWWFRDITSYDTFNKLVPQSLTTDRDPLPLVCTLFANSEIERGMYVLQSSPWEDRDKNALTAEVTPTQAIEIVDRRIETLAAELTTTNAVDRAYYFLEGLHEKGEKVKLTSLNLIICACSLQGDEVRAMETAEAIENFQLKPDASTFKYLMIYSGPLQMRVNTISELLHLMDEMGVARTPPVTHLAMMHLVWLDFIDNAIELATDSIQKDCIYAKSVTHLIRRLIYLGDMFSAAKIMRQAMESPLKEKFSQQFINFVALRTQDSTLKAITK